MYCVHEYYAYYDKISSQGSFSKLWYIMHLTEKRIYHLRKKIADSLLYSVTNVILHQLDIYKVKVIGSAHQHRSTVIAGP